MFDGIVESPHETSAETEKKIKKICSEKLQISTEIELEKVNHVGKPSGERPRPVVVKFLRQKDKTAILQKSKSLKGTNIYINQDFTDQVRRKRKDLMPELKAARARGDIAYLRYDKLIIHSRQPLSSTHEVNITKHKNLERSKTYYQQDEILL